MAMMTVFSQVFICCCPSSPPLHRITSHLLCFEPVVKPNMRGTIGILLRCLFFPLTAFCKLKKQPFIDEKKKNPRRQVSEIDGEEALTSEGAGPEFANSVSLCRTTAGGDSDVCQVSLLRAPLNTHTHTWAPQHNRERD